MRGVILVIEDKRRGEETRDSALVAGGSSFMVTLVHRRSQNPIRPAAVAQDIRAVHDGTSSTNYQTSYYYASYSSSKYNSS